MPSFAGHSGLVRPFMKVVILCGGKGTRLREEIAVDGGISLDLVGFPHQAGARTLVAGLQKTISSSLLRSAYFPPTPYAGQASGSWADLAT